MINQGTGQLKSFKQLGFICKNNSHKPDGWYLPSDTTQVAIILEVKGEPEDLSCPKWVEELQKNILIAQTKYEKVVGILYNHKSVRVFKGAIECTDSVSSCLENKKYYIELYKNDPIDTQQIYLTTMRINNLLHFKFKVNNYYDRMIFTACALVAKRFGADLDPSKDYNMLHYSIYHTLEKKLEEAINKNRKLNTLLEMFSNIQVNITDNQQAIKEFVENVNEIANLINSNNWNGEDVMGIFFNEFNRYKSKSESGQVFTPGHITSLMYRLIGVNMHDRVLDATCGSGAFLTRAMANMIAEAGGLFSKEAEAIMTERLYGIEIDKRVFSLACANMLIHKDGKSNIEQMDATSQEACNWIKSKKITKVLMNPPFERKCHPEIIVKNVLESMEPRNLAAFILPDKKLEKVSKKAVSDILTHHRLKKIIKLPEKTFDEGVSTSIFVFESGIPQAEEEIFTCFIKEDGLERVKNQGRQDIKHKWKQIEDKWVNIINKQSGDSSIQWIKPSEHLSYQIDFAVEVFEEDFVNTLMDYLMFTERINVNDLKAAISKVIIYSGEVSKNSEDNSFTVHL